MTNKYKKKKKAKPSILYLICFGITILFFMIAFTWFIFKDRTPTKKKSRETKNDILTFQEVNPIPDISELLSVHEILSNLSDKLPAYNDTYKEHISYECIVSSLQMIDTHSNLNLQPNCKNREQIESLLLTTMRSLNYSFVISSCLAELSDTIGFIKEYNKEALKITLMHTLNDKSLGAYIKNILDAKEQLKRNFESSFFTKYKKELNNWNELITEIFNKFYKSTLKLIDIYNTAEDSKFDYTDIMSTIASFKKTAVIIPSFVILDTLNYFFEIVVEEESRKINLSIRKDLLEAKTSEALEMYSLYLKSTLMDLLKLSKTYENLEIEGERNNKEKIYSLINTLGKLTNEIVKIPLHVFKEGCYGKEEQE